MKLGSIEEYKDWVLIPIKTNPRFTTYSYLAIAPSDELFHICDEEYQSAHDALSVARRFVDLEEVKLSARPLH
jgi:hypothetical protein